MIFCSESASLNVITYHYRNAKNEMTSLRSDIKWIFSFVYDQIQINNEVAKNDRTQGSNLNVIFNHLLNI